MAEKTNAAKLHSKLLLIQQQLVVTKDQVNKDDEQNTFRFRSAEQILAAAKPILDKVKATLTLSDDVEFQGGRVYIKSTATLFDTETGESISCTALAREADRDGGMSMPQLTGSSSSYARKYALGGLFLLDDNKDPDSGKKPEKDEGVVQVKGSPAPEADPPAEAGTPEEASGEENKPEEPKIVIGKPDTGDVPASAKPDPEKALLKKKTHTASGNLAKALDGVEPETPEPEKEEFEITRKDLEETLLSMLDDQGLVLLLKYFANKKKVDVTNLSQLSDEDINWAIEAKREKMNKANGGGAA